MAGARALVAVILWLTASSAGAATIERLVIPGPVSAAHADIEDDCGSCHSPISDTTQNELCVACHEDVGRDIAEATGFHGLDTDVAAHECQLCHGEHEGRDVATLEFDWAAFDHDLTDFPLAGRHTALECAECHELSAEPDASSAARVPRSAAPATCIGCHEAHDPHESRFGDDCGACHSVSDWQTATFDHAMTGFTLAGRHDVISCESCHVEQLTDPLPSDCNGCHAKDDVHDGTLGGACQTCHATDTWSTGLFDHASTGFQLTGRHGALTCDVCHVSDVPLAGATCHSCHAADDVHDGANGTDCAACHTDSSWTSSTFDHWQEAGFALRGAHVDIACAACHGDDVFSPIGNQCSDCHAADDVHEMQLGTACGGCHGEIDWTHEVRFDHHHTDFPLLGMHAALECAACHQTARFHDADAECPSCHASEDVHDGTLGTACGDCHNPSGWGATTFDHSVTAAFALVGAHVEMPCTACHAKPVMMAASSPEACAQCHRADPHQGRFGDDCGRCHGNDDFREIERLR